MTAWTDAHSDALLEQRRQQHAAGTPGATGTGVQLTAADTLPSDLAVHAGPRASGSAHREGLRRTA